MTTSTTHTESAANPEVAAPEKTYPWVGLLLIVVTAAVTYGGLAVALLS